MLHLALLCLPLALGAASSTPRTAQSPTGPSAAAQATTPSAPELTPATFDALLQRVLPEPAELEWDAIGWRPSLAAAVREARAGQKPVLLWAMNGHPLGCV